MNTTYFYILYVARENVNPGEDDVEEIFYVGRTTTSTKRRLSQHLCEARHSKSRNAKNEYILKKLSKGNTIQCKEVLQIDSEDFLEISKTEDELINAYKNYGYSLFNERSGYSGSYKGVNARIEWTQENLSLLGTDYDKNIAKRLNCTPTAITRKRNEMGVTAFKITKWDANWNKLLGSMSDRELSRKLSVPRSVIAQKREELSIPPLSLDLNWKEEHEKLLGKMSDYDLAKLSNTGREYVRKRRIRSNISPF